MGDEAYERMDYLNYQLMMLISGWCIGRFVSVVCSLLLLLSLEHPHPYVASVEL